MEGLPRGCLALMTMELPFEARPEQQEAEESVLATTGHPCPSTLGQNQLEGQGHGLLQNLRFPCQPAFQ